MRRCLAIALLFVGLCFQVSPATQAKTGTARIIGHVTRTDTGAPVPDATVRLLSVEFLPVQHTTSEDLGQFELKDIPAGEYRLTALAAGLASADATPGRPFGMGKPITLIEGQQLSKVELAVTPMPALEGRVLDVSGTPLKDVPVSLAQLRNVGDKATMVPTGLTLRTDASGAYKFLSVMPGDYYVLATAGPFSRTAPNDTQTLPDHLQRYAPTYFPGTDRAAAASPVRVQMGIDALDVTFSLVPTTGVRMSGVVWDLDGRPVSDANLLLIPTELGAINADLAAKTKSNALGQFVYPAIPSGTYVLQSFSSNLFGSRPVVVPPTQDEFSGIDLTVRPLVSARGRLSFEGGPPPAKSLLAISFAPTDFASGPVGSNANVATVYDDWTFEINHLAWIGVLTVRAPATWRLKSVLLNGVDIADVPHDFQTADVNGLELLMTNRLASISGTVSDGTRAASSAVVLVFPEDSAKLRFPSRLMSATSTGAEGQFALNNLLAGRYRIVAVATLQFPSPDWIASLRPFATSVTVTENEAKSVSLKLIKR